MIPANDNAVAVRTLRLPHVDLGAGVRLPGGRVAMIARGGGVGHGCMVTVRPVGASLGKFHKSTGGAA